MKNTKMNLAPIDAIVNSIELKIGDTVEFESKDNMVRGVYDVVEDSYRDVENPCSYCHFEDGTFRAYCAAIRCSVAKKGFHLVKQIK